MMRILVSGKLYLAFSFFIAALPLSASSASEAGGQCQVEKCTTVKKETKQWQERTNSIQDRYVYLRKKVFLDAIALDKRSAFMAHRQHLEDFRTALGEIDKQAGASGAIPTLTAFLDALTVAYDAGIALESSVSTGANTEAADAEFVKALHALHVPAFAMAALDSTTNFYTQAERWVEAQKKKHFALTARYEALQTIEDSKKTNLSDDASTDLSLLDKHSVFLTKPVGMLVTKLTDGEGSNLDCSSWTYDQRVITALRTPAKVFGHLICARKKLKLAEEKEAKDCKHCDPKPKPASGTGVRVVEVNYGTDRDNCDATEYFRTHCEYIVHSVTFCQKKGAPVGTLESGTENCANDIEFATTREDFFQRPDNGLKELCRVKIVRNMCGGPPPAAKSTRRAKITYKCTDTTDKSNFKQLTKMDTEYAYLRCPKS